MSLSEPAPVKRKPGRPPKSESLAPLWRELIDAAEAFRAAKPWATFANLQYFCVNLPGGELGIACVLGNGGETFGLVLYVGRGVDIALKTYRVAFETPEADCPLDFESVMESDYLRLEFVHENELPAAARKRLLAAGWSPSRQRAKAADAPPWLHFESGIAGSQPEPTITDPAEIGRLAKALRDVVALMKYRKELIEFDTDAGVWALDDERTFPSLPKGEEVGGFGWRKLRYAPPEPRLPFAEIGEARRLPSSDEVWEMARGLTLSVKPVKVPGSDRKWFDRVLFVGRHTDPNKAPTPLFTNRSAALGNADDAARHNLLAAVTKAGVRPALLLYEDDALGAALKPLADALEIRIQKSKQPLGVTGALKMMNSGFLPPG